MADEQNSRKDWRAKNFISRIAKKQPNWKPIHKAGPVDVSSVKFKTIFNSISIKDWESFREECGSFMHATKEDGKSFLSKVYTELVEENKIAKKEFHRRNDVYNRLKNHATKLGEKPQFGKHKIIDVSNVDTKEILKDKKWIKFLKQYPELDEKALKEYQERLIQKNDEKIAKLLAKNKSGNEGAESPQAEHSESDNQFSALESNSSMENRDSNNRRSNDRQSTSSRDRHSSGNSSRSRRSGESMDFIPLSSDDSRSRDRHSRDRSDRDRRHSRDRSSRERSDRDRRPSRDKSSRERGDYDRRRSSDHRSSERRSSDSRSRRSPDRHSPRRQTSDNHRSSGYGYSDHNSRSSDNRSSNYQSSSYNHTPSSSIGTSGIPRSPLPSFNVSPWATRPPPQMNFPRFPRFTGPPPRFRNDHMSYTPANNMRWFGTPRPPFLPRPHFNPRFNGRLGPLPRFSVPPPPLPNQEELQEQRKEIKETRDKVQSQVDIAKKRLEERMKFRSKASDLRERLAKKKRINSENNMSEENMSGDNLNEADEEMDEGKEERDATHLNSDLRITNEEYRDVGGGRVAVVNNEDASGNMSGNDAGAGASHHQNGAGDIYNPSDISEYAKAIEAKTKRDLEVSNRKGLRLLKWDNSGGLKRKRCISENTEDTVGFSHQRRARFSDYYNDVDDALKATEGDADPEAKAKFEAMVDNLKSILAQSDHETLDELIHCPKNLKRNLLKKLFDDHRSELSKRLSELRFAENSAAAPVPSTSTMTPPPASNENDSVERKNLIDLLESESQKSAELDPNLLPFEVISQIEEIVRKEKQTNVPQQKEPQPHLQPQVQLERLNEERIRTAVQNTKELLENNKSDSSSSSSRSSSTSPSNSEAEDDEIVEVPVPPKPPPEMVDIVSEDDEAKASSSSSSSSSEEESPAKVRNSPKKKKQPNQFIESSTSSGTSSESENETPAESATNKLKKLVYDRKALNTQLLQQRHKEEKLEATAAEMRKKISEMFKKLEEAEKRKEKATKDAAGTEKSLSDIDKKISDIVTNL